MIFTEEIFPAGATTTFAVAPFQFASNVEGFETALAGVDIFTL